MDRAGALGNLLSAVPGYRGYRAKEDRRDADRVVRDKLVADLDLRASRIEAVASNLGAQRDLANVGTVNALARDIRTLATRIRTASYGYGGLFGDRDVNEFALAQIQAFDEALLEGAAAFDGPVTALQRATPDTIATMSAEVAAITNHLNEQFNARSSVVETAQPSTVEPAPPPVSSALDKQEPATSPAVFDLHDRDAIAIMGDNLVVDARIELAGPGNYRLFRFGGDPKKWLVVSKKAGDPIYLMTESPKPTDAGTGGEAAKALGSVIGAGGEQRNVPVTYTFASVASAPGEQSLLLDWGAEQQFFAGSEVHPDDIELFGSTLR